MTSSDSSSPLRGWLRANALFSALSGIAILLASRALPDVIGAGGRALYLMLGVLLALYAVHLWRVGGRAVARGEAHLIVAGDVAWVLGSVVLVVSGLLTPAGGWLVSLVAVVIAVFAVGQWRAVRATVDEPA